MFNYMRSILTACLALAAGSLPAQKPVFKHPFASAVKPDVLTMPHYNGGHTAFMIKNARRMDFLLVNPAFTVVHKFTDTQRVEQSIYSTRSVSIGCIWNGGMLYNFLYDTEGRSSRTTENGRDAVLIDKIDFAGGKTELSLKHALPEGEKLANAFTYNNTLFLLSASQDGITVCYIDSTLNKTVRNFELDFAGLTGSMIRLEDALRSARVVQPGETDADAYTAPVKIFPATNGLCLAFDYKNRSVLLRMDTYNNTLADITPDYGVFSGDNSQYIYNTVAYGHIFSLAASKPKMELAVFDMTGKKMLKKFESAKDDGNPSFTFAAPALVSWSKGKSGGEKMLDNTGAFAKEMLSGSGGVRVVKNDAGQYVLTVAAFKNGVTPLPFPGISYPAEPVPGTVFPFHSVNYGNRLLVKTSFSAAVCKTVLNAANFEKIKQSLKPGPLEKLRSQFEMEENIPESVTLFMVNGGWYYPWYDAEAQQFTIRGVK